MKKILFVLNNLHSMIDVITNSSSELFVGNSNNKKEMLNLIKEVYPNYLNEYEELKGIDDLTIGELETYIDFYCSPLCWPAKKEYYPILPGFTFDELYEAENNKPAWNGEIQYQLKNNDSEYAWGGFVTESNFEEIKNKLDPNRQMYFLFSLDDNPNWEYQERLQEIMERFHLG
jgi:hypothetical protein